MKTIYIINISHSDIPYAQTAFTNRQQAEQDLLTTYNNIDKTDTFHHEIDDTDAPETFSIVYNNDTTIEGYIYDTLLHDETDEVQSSNHLQPVTIPRRLALDMLLPKKTNIKFDEAPADWLNSKLMCKGFAVDSELDLSFDEDDQTFNSSTRMLQEDRVEIRSDDYESILEDESYNQFQIRA